MNEDATTPAGTMNEGANMTPGQYPYRQGITDEPYAQKPWVIGQYSGFSDPRSTNRRFREIAAKGGDGLAIALDLPTQWGLDPDHELARGEIGRVGVSLSSLDDLDELLQGIPLDSIRQFSSTANSIGPVMIALFIALARRRGAPVDSFSLRLQNDPLKEYVARGTHVLPVAAGAEFAVDAIEYCARRLPNWVPMSISGYHMRDAGATRAQELGFTMAHARDYLYRCQRRGVSPEQVAKSVTWFLAASEAPIHEAAKFRAARELWATMLADDFGVTDPMALKLRIIAYTLGGEMSPFEPYNNSVRITLAALGAVLGGVQIIFCSSVDEALGIPSDTAALLSIRTQQVILRESGLADFVDVLGGAPAVEELTDQLAAEAREIEEKVRAQGGVATAIDSGWTRGEIDAAAWAQELSRREHPRVGEEPDAGRDTGDVRLFQSDPDAEEHRVESFNRWRAARSEDDVIAGCSAVRAEVAAGRNPIDAMTDALSAGATIGEIMRLLRDQHGVSSDRSMLATTTA
jgi:methylmalonyl-CoA mutase N-terminal domain/subunit